MSAPQVFDPALGSTGAQFLSTYVFMVSAFLSCRLNSGSPRRGSGRHLRGNPRSRKAGAFVSFITSQVVQAASRLMPSQRKSISLSFGALLVLPLICGSCSLVLVNTVPTRAEAALQPGAERRELVAHLGQPHSSTAQPLTSTAFVLRTNEQPAICDVYQVSKLVQIPNDPYSTDWNVYPAFVIVTLGLAEIVTFPYVVVDLTIRSLQQRELLVWYNGTDRLIAYERRKRREAH